MAAPSYVQASTGNTDSVGGWTATCFAPTAADRIIIFQFLQDGSGVASTISSTTNIKNLAGTAGQWTSIGTFPVGSPTVANQMLWIGRSTGTSAPVITGANSSGDDGYWRFYEFADCSDGTTLAELIENVTAGTATNAAGTAVAVAPPSLTSIGQDRLFLAFTGINDDNVINAFSGNSRGLWQEAIAEFATATGTDASIGLSVARSPWWLASSVSAVSVAYGNGYWVAGGGAGALWYKAGDKPDDSWTSNPQGAIAHTSVAYGNGYWVAVGISGNLYYKSSTPDGAWTSNAQGATTFRSVAYGNGYWVAVGDSGTLYYKSSTPDGAWTSNAQGATGHFGVAYDNGYWVAVGASGNLYYKSSTPDGAWTSNAQGATTFRHVAYGDGYWAACGNSGNLYYKASTPDGAWTSNAFPVADAVNSIAYGGGWWVAAGSFEYQWYKENTPSGVWSFNPQVSVVEDLAYGAGYWVIVGTTSKTYWTDLTPGSSLPLTISGGSFNQSDGTDGWGVVTFALIGTTKTIPVSLNPPRLISRQSISRSSDW